VDDSFTPLKLPIQDVYEAIKNQPWVKRPESKQHNLARPGAKDYRFFHDNKGLQTSQFRSLRKYLKDLIQQGYLREYFLTPEATKTERQQETMSPN